MTQATGNGTNLLVQGRIVWTVGDLFQGRIKTDYHTKQQIMGQDGQPVKEYGFGLAVPKVDQSGQQTEEFKKVWEAIHSEAFKIFNQGLPPNFSMKCDDGDGIDSKGKPFADRKGYAGHFILRCTTRIPLKFFIWQNNTNVMVNEGIKSGDYVNVQLNLKAHNSSGNPGLYINPSMVQLIQPGEEIVNAPSGDQVFGAVAPSYAGQVQAPTAPVMPQANPTGQAQMPTPGAPAPNTVGGMPAATGQQTQANPHYGVLPQNMQPQGQAQMPTPGAPAPNTVGGMPVPGNVNMGQPAAQTNAMPQMPTAPGAPAQ